MQQTAAKSFMEVVVEMKRRNVLKGLVLTVICAVILGSFIPSVMAASPKLSKKTLTLYVGKSKTLKVTGSRKKVTWKSSNKKIASVKSGKVTGVKAGKATIYAKTAGKTLTCKVTVKNNDVTAKSVSFTTADGGEFIRGKSTAVLKYTMPSKASLVQIDILTATGSVLLSKKFNNIPAKVRQEFKWSPGAAQSAGSYRAKITAGKKAVYSDYLILKEKGDFSGGAGTKASPYQISTLDELKKMSKFSSSCFVLVNDIDFNYKSCSAIFGEENAFSGTLDGKGFSIRNFYGTNSLFGFIGENGQINSLTLDNCTVTGENAAVFADNNSGMITACKMTNCVVSGVHQATLYVYKNSGTILDCSIVKGTAAVTGSGYNNYWECASGFANENNEGGQIRNCKADINCSATAKNFPCSSTIVGINYAVVESCEGNGSLTVTKGNNYGGQAHMGGIVGCNRGIVRSCDYAGDSTSDIVGWNDGGTVI